MLIFYNLPQSKRGVYLLCMYPALATLVAIYLRQAIVQPATSSSVVRWLARLSGFAMLLLGSAALVALAMLVASPREFADLLQVGNIGAPAFAPTLASTVRDHWMLALAMPLAVVVLGVRLIVTRPLVERMVFAIAAAMVFITVAVNVVVVPAIANTLSLKDFTNRAMKVVDDSPVGYLNALNYDVAFYSRRTIPIVSQKDPDLPRVSDRVAHSLRCAPRIEAQPLRNRDGIEPHFARRQRRDAPAPPARRCSNANTQTFR